MCCGRSVKAPEVRSAAGGQTGDEGGNRDFVRWRRDERFVALSAPESVRGQSCRGRNADSARKVRRWRRDERCAALGPPQSMGGHAGRGWSGDVCQLRQEVWCTAGGRTDAASLPIS